MAEPGVETRTRSSVITARAAASFEPVGRSVAAARAFVRDTLQGWGHGDVVDDAVVLTSELVTNAVIHAGTAADVLCLRTEQGVRVEVADHYPEREVPLQGAGRPVAALDRENGRGLLLCSALASRWGVDYSPASKNVWFQLDLPERPVGTRHAGPAVPTALLPVADERVRVAVLQVDPSGAITAWNDDAESLFGYAADQVVGKQLGDFAAWPHTPGTGTGLAEALQLSRWEGSYGLRAAPTAACSRCTRPTCGSATPRASRRRSACSYATTSGPSCRPRPGPPPPPAATRQARVAGPIRSRCSSAPPPPTTSTGSCSARWSAPGTCWTATPRSCSSPRTTRPSWRCAPPRGCPRPASASPASPSRRAPAGTPPPACRPSTRTWRPCRGPCRSSAARACGPSSPCR